QPSSSFHVGRLACNQALTSASDMGFSRSALILPLCSFYRTTRPESYRRFPHQRKCDAAAWILQRKEFRFVRLSPALSATIRVTAPARLHLGFLDLDGALGRRFGSIGLAVDHPETELTLKRAPRHEAHGLESKRALALVEKFARGSMNGGYA